VDGRGGAGERPVNSERRVDDIWASAPRRPHEHRTSGPGGVVRAAPLAPRRKV